MPQCGASRHKAWGESSGGAKILRQGGQIVFKSLYLHSLLIYKIIFNLTRGAMPPPLFSTTGGHGPLAPPWRCQWAKGHTSPQVNIGKVDVKYMQSLI